jgi:hypothetical protein
MATAYKTWVYAQTQLNMEEQPPQRRRGRPRKEPDEDRSASPTGAARLPPPEGGDCHGASRKDQNTRGYRRGIEHYRHWRVRQHFGIRILRTSVLIRS